MQAGSLLFKQFVKNHKIKGIVTSAWTMRKNEEFSTKDQ